jgi:hypothetical protein
LLKIQSDFPDKAGRSKNKSRVEDDELAHRIELCPSGIGWIGTWFGDGG